MASSGTNTFLPEISEIIEEAYELAGVELRTGYQLRSAIRSLDLLMIEWANRGYNLWTIEQTSTSTVAGTITYTLAATVTDVIEAAIVVDSNDFVMNRIASTDYMGITNKTSQSRPTSYWLKRDSTPILYLWPAPDKVYTLKYWQMRRIYDSGAASNTMDVPFRFLPAIIGGLAHKLAAKSKDQTGRVPFLEAEYEKQWKLATAEDREKVSFFVRRRVR